MKKINNKTSFQNIYVNTF